MGSDLGRIIGMNFGARRKRVWAAAQAVAVQALVVAHLPDVRYLTGFTGSNGVVVLTGGKAFLFTDGRYMGQARAEAPGVKVVIEKNPRWGCLCVAGGCRGAAVRVR